LRLTNGQLFSFSAFSACSYKGRLIFWVSGMFLIAISQFAIAFLASPSAV
jgi:hypothetical protein